VKNEPTIVSETIDIGEGFEAGPDVSIRAKSIAIGNNVRVGMLDEESFRHPGGVRISVQSLHLDDDVVISRATLIKGGDIKIGKRSVVKENSTIDVRSHLHLGEGSYLNPYTRITGRDIEIGQNFRMLRWSWIGGGSCFEVQSKLRMGHDCHLGEFAQINTADSVTIGNEVGIGVRSGIFTHGAYQSFLRGFPVSFGPVTIGDNCWLPHAYVLPNVEIGESTVVAAGSVVNRNLPSFCLAGGVPAKVIRENVFREVPNLPARTALMQGFLDRLIAILENEFGLIEASSKYGDWIFAKGPRLIFSEVVDENYLLSSAIPQRTVVISLKTESESLSVAESKDICLIATDLQKVTGNIDGFAARIVNQFRRNGVRLQGNE
jgi:acetyltransferase-like isoleucine patch superfamily enzyme